MKLNNYELVHEHLSSHTLIGVFILVFVLLASHLIELIPNTALAAMLITVGIKLAHPK